MFIRSRWVAVAAASLLLLLPYASAANPDADETGSVTIEDPTFGAYTATKSSEFYRDTNPANPVPVLGFNTYVYTITNQTGGQIGLVGFGVQIPDGTATVVHSVGFIAGSGVEPTGIEISPNEVKWTFFDNLVMPGAVSARLYIISAYQPGTADFTVNGQFGADANGSCELIPVIPPDAVGDPNPCTIGFWKNREDGKKGTLQHFPDGEFEALKAEAVSISTVFSTEAELVEALTSKGKRTVEERAQQQLAALLLNIAAGRLFPDNTKCRLFLLNEVDTDGDGTANMTVAEALTEIESNILSGDPELQKQAQGLADDINNGIGVLGFHSSG
jgi:hypothetical protein